MSTNLALIVEYIRQNRDTYTREAITSRLLETGYREDEIEVAWHAADNNELVANPETSATDPNVIGQYIEQYHNVYTREAITSQLVTAGYSPGDIEASWHALDAGVPNPPSTYAGVKGLSKEDWDSGTPEQERSQRLVRSQVFWAYTVGFIILSYILPGIVLWIGAARSDGTIANIALAMFLLLQLGALLGGLVSFRGNRPRAAGLLIGMLMTLVVIPTCAVALFFGLCIASLSGIGI